MITTEITPVERDGDILVKREDYAYADGIGACGAKVRQYMAMVEARPDAPLIVGCSANSAQQVYIADAVRRTGRRGIVVVPARRERTAATVWAAENGAEIVEVRPGWRPYCISQARLIGRPIGAVSWDPAVAIADTAAQTINVPEGARIVVSAGAGTVAAGIMAGLAHRDDVTFVLVQVSPQASVEDILRQAGLPQDEPPPITWVPMRLKYNTPFVAELGDGTVLDPFYAAKALPYTEPGDLLWVTGARPLAAMPGRR